MAKKQPAAPSAGFPMLERLLDQDRPDLTHMQAHYEELLGKSRLSRRAQEKAAAKQAAIAYERFFELFDHLIKVRSKITQ